MTQRYCACGTKIRYTRQLCEKCYKEYGGKRALWPEWLRDWMRSTERELIYDQKHNHVEYLDETDLVAEKPSERWIYTEAYNNLFEAQSNPEMDFEDFIWANV